MSRKAPSTIIKELTAEIERLESELKSAEQTREMYRKENADLEKEIESVHVALDTMFVPRMVKVGYNEKTMTIASRLFAWQAGAKIQPTSSVEIE